MAVQVDTAPVTEEVEVYRSSDGCSRASIVRRPDGFFCIYVFLSAGDSPASMLYGHPDRDDQGDFARPEQGLYGTVEEARREVRTLRGFTDAALQT